MERKIYIKMMAIIPARKGSKRLPDKNMKSIDGKTLVEYAIDSAIGSMWIDGIIISTDDDRIKDIVNKYKPEDKVIFHKRPDDLVGDDVLSQSVVDDVINKHKCNSGYILLQPTSPLRTPEDIDRCAEKYDGFSSVISVVEEDGVYKHNGAVYVFNDTIYTNEKFLYVMPKERSIDIDTQDDFNKAEDIICKTK